jgi:hypothetical protein
MNFLIFQPDTLVAVCGRRRAYLPDMKNNGLQFEMQPSIPSFVPGLGEMAVACFTPVNDGVVHHPDEHDDKPFRPACNICRKPIPIEEAKTDGDGKPVHEECYVKSFIASPHPENTQGNA